MGIMEETPVDEQEDSIVEEVFREAEAAVPDADATEPTRERKYSLVPTDVLRARQALGMAKAKNLVARSREDKKLAATRIERRVSQPPPPKKRHVFTFETRESQGSRRDHLHVEASMSQRALPGIPKAAPARNWEKRPRASHERPDDWISSFD